MTELSARVASEVSCKDASHHWRTIRPSKIALHLCDNLMPTSLDTQISAVTVYSSQALIIRRGTVDLQGSERELVIHNLPMTLQTDSIRVAGSGTQNLKLLGVKTESVTTLESSAPEVADLEAQITKLEHQQHRYTDQLEAVKLKLHAVEALSEQSIPTLSKQIVKKQTLTATQALFEFLGEQYEDYAKTITRIERQQQTLQQQNEILHTQLKQLQNQRPHNHYNLTLKIAPAAAGRFELEITYRVTQAQWRPQYDLQFDTDTGMLALSYLAEVKQTSGEAWSGVALTLSTAKPGLGALSPQLKPWFIHLPSIETQQKRKSAAPMAGAAYEAVEDLKSSAPASAKPTAKKRAEVITTDISKSGRTISFNVGGNSDIPSDGNPHTVTLANHNHPVDCQFVAIPSQVSFAYLQATVHNPTDGVTLLPGKASIFRDRTFVGTTDLKHIAPGQDLQTDLGIDEGLGIERELIERQVDKKLMGGQRRITFAYRLVITNFLEQPAQLKLTEQLPTSRDERLKVRLTHSQPRIEVGELGQLTWTLALSPQQQQVVEYHFTVEHPPTESIRGLGI